MPQYCDISTLTLEEEPVCMPAFELFDETIAPLEVQAAPVRTPSAPIAGVYSNSGFDMIQVLSSLANRPNPEIHLGPIDLSCSFLVSDARQYDCPIIYCSPAFETLTGYSSNEILGKNCRFLQAPDGLVTGGSRRRHTDNQAVYHLKAQLIQNREHQASIINYRKGGQAFVNLITVIPLLDNQGEVAYYVGLQVDLVEQPNSIMEKMKDGTYMINYQQNPLPLQLPDKAILDQMDDYFRELPSLGSTYSFLTNPEVMALVKSKSARSRCDSENEQSYLLEWNKLILDQSDDFIHVVSLKGFFLYCSGAAKNLLEYEPEDLLGKSLSSICHPSDIVPVMREIKEAAASGNSGKVVDLLFRVRRKYSGYMWMECRGRLHMDQSKSRKCLVLSGRQRPVYKLHWRDICSTSLEGTEFWAKTSLAGLYLHVAAKCQETIGFSAESLEGASIYQYIPNHEIPDMSRAFDLVRQGQRVNLQHSILNEKGNYSTVTSTFYPGDVSSFQSEPAFALVQTRLGREEMFRTDNNLQENVFSEIEPTRGTSWQYELHQLQLANKRLHEQIESLSGPKRKKQRKRKHIQEISKMCAQCQSQDSPEWRRGPNGPKELCNACGLRYAKTIQTRPKITAI
ncbi:GATA-type zinc finger transcription factor [Phycomyces blakesleeanus]|uniref:GATA-type zinc finger transcription factor n=2 Tax=Phycomyces blakesleeanus TaxID=4837 RepID=A0A167LN99_PHYB8|nr:GATA-type zinc finger transcription factor [Phycomyces blakesleeanus NRRL 1555(-)]ABB77844.1 white collar one A [Phycomyces blakesleeanus]OAD70786.1 GATA-type zinc finger transcription factor [Phycomyces blakesleeanus NRRL 1555(-)]|eukprot:XP_018288826.1 GATA-type zinc finger transcription factor [Phycomyces blakesleeanus NRRL 1555(-)]